MLTRHFITFLFPGLVVGESSTREYTPGEKIEPPTNAYGYETWERTEIEHDGDTLVGKSRNKRRVLIGEVYTVDRVEREFPDKNILLANMRGNGYAACVRSPQDWWTPLTDGDVVEPAT